MVSVLGQRHEALAYHMTFRAILAAVVTVVGITSLAMAASVPFTLIILPLYVVAELVFAIIYVYRYLLLSYQPIKHRPLSHDPRDAFERAMQHMQQFADIRHFLSIWFHGAPFEDIKRENVADLLAYAFFYRTRDEIAAEGLSAELESMVAFIEHTWGVELTPGYNPKLRWMCHLWEPMRHWYRPLGFYLFMEFAAVIGNTALRAAGFKQSTWMGIAYFMKHMPADKHSPGPGTAAAADGDRSREDVPLVLLHGIGMGLIPYISLLFNMAATGRPVLALQLKHVSMRWVLWVPTVDEVADVLVGILRREGVDQCCMVAHSYGTAVASRLLQQHPQKILQLCMIDPVCFSMFMPNLLRNFLYESPRTGSLFGDFMMMSAARDLHVAATLSRRFFWTDVNLWEEQLPPGSLVVLSGRDVLMAAAEVKAWLELRTDAVVMYHPELPHAGFLMDVTWQQQILQQLLPLLDHVVGQQQQEQQQPKKGADPSSCKTFVDVTAQMNHIMGHQGQQQPRTGPVTPQSPLPHQQRRSGVTECSAASDSCSRGSSIELTAVAAIAAATGMIGYPGPHVLSGGTATAGHAAGAGPVTSDDRRSLDMKPVPVPAVMDVRPMLAALTSSSSRGSSAAAALGTAVLSSSSSSSGLLQGDASSRGSSSSAGSTVCVRGCLSAAPASESKALPDQLEQQSWGPRQSWNSLMQSSESLPTDSTPRGWATTSSTDIPFDVQSVGSAMEGNGSTADCTDSPRTYFSGMSSQSWQDFAQLAHSKEAATAARVLLQPLLALQQRRRQQQQQQHLGQVSSKGLGILDRQRLQGGQSGRGSVEVALTRLDGQCSASSGGLVSDHTPSPWALRSAGESGSSSAIKREGMMRRVEVLLHRRGGRQSSSSSRIDASSARGACCQANIVL